MKINKKYIIYTFIFLLVCVGVYLYFYKQIENFTDIEKDMVTKIKEFLLNTPDVNYIAFAKKLGELNNKSLNLVKIDTFKILQSKGKNITDEDILSLI